MSLLSKVEEIRIKKSLTDQDIEFFCEQKKPDSTYTKEDFNTDVNWLNDKGIALDEAEDLINKLVDSVWEKR